MKIIYPAIFHKEDDSYWAEFPDLEGCQSFGDSIKEVFENSQEALEAYTLSLLEEEKKLPKSTDIQTIDIPKNSFVSLVETDLSPYLNKSKAIKKTLTIPEWLNEAAVKENINFSQTLQEAILEKLSATK